jgi:hypothetical protein
VKTTREMMTRPIFASVDRLNSRSRLRIVRGDITRLSVR